MNEARVLIVDDDQALLEALPRALLLRLNGVQVDTCDSARAALDRIEETDYDAIVTDIKMPGMDGLALLGAINERRPATPTLLVTGHGEHDLTVQALRGGAYDFIQKPIDRDYFVASLMRAIEKRQLDRALERHKAALEQHARVLEHVADGVFLVDPVGLLQLWNPAAEAITGLRADDVLGRPASDVLSGWEQAVALIPVTRAPGAGSDGAKTVPLEVGGREIWLSASGVEFAEGTVYAFRDLTGERTVDELAGEFLATVSHELRTPLAAIYGAAETLRRRPAVELDETIRERLLEVIAAESDRLARVVGDILLASRLDSGRLQLARSPVEPVDLARGVLEAIEPLVPKNVTLELAAPPSLPLVTTDADKLRQVLVNLIENAIKYSPEGGRVQVEIESRDGRLRFIVRDEGMGVPPHEQRRIFDKFHRVDPNLTRGVAGTGLGLYICRELLRRLEGRLWVESQVGKGSAFFVDLPLALPEREPAEARAASGVR